MCIIICTRTCSVMCSMHVEGIAKGHPHDIIIILCPVAWVADTGPGKYTSLAAWVCFTLSYETRQADLVN